jgi:etoposide-induced 2.4 mRNA
MLADFLNGVSTGIAFYVAWPVFLKSSKVRKNALQSFLFNGLIFLSSILVVEYFIFPLFRSAKFLIASFGWLDTLLAGITRVVYYCFWLLPLYVISLMLNMSAVTEVAEDTFIVLKIKQDVSSEAARVLADVIFESIFVAVCMIVAAVIDLLVALAPYVSPLLWVFYPCSFLFWTWIMAFCAFNTKWKLQGVGILRRVRAIETNFAFYAGFGTPITAFTYFYPNFFVNAIVYSLMYPWVVIIACASHNESSDPTLNPILNADMDESKGKWPIFKIPLSIAHCLVRKKNL